MIKILFADDDLKYSMLLKSFLQQHGYDVTYAGNGKRAWEQFPEVKPDLVLLDINMPEMDGYEVAERIRTIDPKVLIFFLTDRTEKTAENTGKTSSETERSIHEDFNQIYEVASAALPSAEQLTINRQGDNIVISTLDNDGNMQHYAINITETQDGSYQLLPLAQLNDL